MKNQKFVATKMHCWASKFSLNFSGADRAAHLPLHLVSILKYRSKMASGDAAVQLLADDRGADPKAAKRRVSPEAAAASKRARMQLTVAMVFCFMFMAGEVVGGYLAHSLAIMTE